MKKLLVIERIAHWLAVTAVAAAVVIEHFRNADMSAWMVQYLAGLVP